MTSTAIPAPAQQDSANAQHLDALREIEQRVLWLSAAIVDHANRVRPNASGLKVGGHQASSASIVTIMTSLWFEHLQQGDRVSVKPHASPVLHAINYLLDELDESYLTTLRSFGGLQSYPSRAKDPDPADYSTGSVGIGATAPVWGALSRRYINAHFGSGGTGRQYSLVGDAELDEGAIWEAVLDPMVAELGEVVWIIDLNRQSLDRVVPNIGTPRLQGMFAAAGWQVLTVKYGQLLEDLFARPGGDVLRNRIDTMTNPEYQRLLRCTPAQLRDRLPGDTPDADAIRLVLADVTDDILHAAVRNLGGHDLVALREAYAAIDDTRPTVIFAYTVKGYGLASEGHPQNHSALMTLEQLTRLAERVGMTCQRPLAEIPTSHRSGPAVCGDQRTAATRNIRIRGRPADTAGSGTYPDRGRDHPSRPRPHAARPQSRRTRSRPSDRHREPGRQLQHQPRRLGQQGRRVVAERAIGLVRRRL